MEDIKLIYYCYPLNVWFSILKAICDIVLIYKCSSIIFKDIVSVEDDLPDFSITSMMMNKLHTGLRIIIQSTNQDNIVKNSFNILSTIITKNDFQYGSFVMNLTEPGCDPATVFTEIRFRGERYLWKELIFSINEILKYFLIIKASFLNNPLTNQGVDLIINLIASFKKTIKIISNSITQNQRNIVKLNIDNGNILFENYSSLIYIPKFRLCHIYKNYYINFEPRQGKTEINKDNVIYKIYFDGVGIMKFK